MQDNRYTIDFSSGKPQVEARHAEDKEAGAFSSNLGRLPLLRLPDGASIGQSKAIGESDTSRWPSWWSTAHQ